MTAPLIVPQPRVDLFVDRAPDGARHRLTTYCGQIQCGTRTSVLGAAAWGSLTTFQYGWLLPDSLPYRADRIRGALVRFSVTPLSLHTVFDVQQLSAGLAPDPNQAHAWVRLDTSISTKTGAIGTYRIEVLVPADAVVDPAGT